MCKDSSIQWTDHTFNPWRGCAKVSPGCTNCYAEVLSKRNPAVLGKWGLTGTRVVASEPKWREPLAWDREAAKLGVRKRVFCASLADVFEDWRGSMVDSQGDVLWHRSGNIVKAGATTPGQLYGERPATMDDVRRRLARLIRDTPHLDWQLLTKRPENAGQMIYRMWFDDAEWPSNYWLGTTVENGNAKHRVDILRKIPAPLRFLSIEPMLDGIDRLDLDGISWVIVGGESGGHARPFDLAWARSIRDQCRAAGVAFFCKQLGSNCHGYWLDPNAPGDAICHHSPDRGWKLKDSHGGDEAEWPEDLRGCREFPRSEVTA